MGRQEVCGTIEVAIESFFKRGVMPCEHSVDHLGVARDLQVTSDRTGKVVDRTQIVANDGLTRRIERLQDERHDHAGSVAALLAVHQHAAAGGCDGGQGFADALGPSLGKWRVVLGRGDATILEPCSHHGSVLQALLEGDMDASQRSISKSLVGFGACSKIDHCAHTAFSKHTP